jgi:hypothetical protein
MSREVTPSTAGELPAVREAMLASRSSSVRSVMGLLWLAFALRPASAELAVQGLVPFMYHPYCAPAFVVL